MDFDGGKARILDALMDHEGIQHIVNIAAEVLGNPVFVNDMSQKLLACSNSRDEDAQMWSELLPGGYLEADRTMAVESSGIYAKILETDKPVFGQFSFSPYRFLGARIRDKSQIVGIVTLVGREPFGKDDGKLLIVTCRALLLEMLYVNRNAMQVTPYYSLFQDLLERAITEDEMRERVDYLRISPPAHFRLVAIGYPRQRPGVLMYHARDMLNSALGDAYSILYGNRILVILDEKRFSETTLAIMRGCFSHAKIEMGVSRMFDSLWNLPQAFEQATVAIELYRKLGIESESCLYDEVYLYHFFDTASREHNLHVFCNPVVANMDAYDAANHSSMRETLEAYLDCGRDVQRTADRLFVHKNTVYHRLQKVEETFGIDLDDENTCFSLEFSFRLLRIID